MRCLRHSARRVIALLLTVAAVLSLDFRFEEINILPDVLVLAALIPALVFFRKTVDWKRSSSIVYMSSFGVLSVLSYWFERHYIENYTYNAMQRDPKVFTAYLIWVGAVALQGIFFILMLSSVFKCTKTVIKEHTGYVLGKEINTEKEREQIADVQNELGKEFELALDFGVLYAVSDLLYSLYGAFYAFMNKNMGFFNVINIGCGFLFIGMLLRAMSDMKEAVEVKYMLE